MTPSVRERVAWLRVGMGRMMATARAALAPHTSCVLCVLTGANKKGASPGGVTGANIKGASPGGVGAALRRYFDNDTYA